MKRRQKEKRGKKKKNGDDEKERDFSEHLPVDFCADFNRSERQRGEEREGKGKEKKDNRPVLRFRQCFLHAHVAKSPMETQRKKKRGKFPILSVVS